jgi:hypothetical protein
LYAESSLDLSIRNRSYFSENVLRSLVVSSIKVILQDLLLASSVYKRLNFLVCGMHKLEKRQIKNIDLIISISSE